MSHGLDPEKVVTLGSVKSTMPKKRKYRGFEVKIRFLYIARIVLSRLCHAPLLFHILLFLDYIILFFLYSS